MAGCTAARAVPTMQLCIDETTATASVAKKMFVHEIRQSDVVTCAMHRLLNKVIIVRMMIGALISAVHAAPVHSVAPASGDPIVLVFAEEYSVSTRDSLSVRELSGKVHLEHGNVTVYCDKATQYPVANKVFLRGHVRIIQGTLTMKMPEGEYDGMKSIATGIGGVEILDGAMQLFAPVGTYNTSTSIVDFSDGVVVEDDSLCITSERAQYSRSTKDSYAWTNVVVRNKKSRVILVGDSAFNQPSAGYSRVEGNAMLEQCEQIPADSASAPVDSAVGRVPATPSATATPQRKGKKRTNVIQPLRKSNSQGSTAADSSRSAAVQMVADSSRISSRDSSKSTIDTLTIRAQRMESLRQTARDRYMAEGNVEIVRGTLATRSSRCMYDNTDETFELRGDPLVWADSLALHADSVVMQFKKRKLVQLHAAGSAFLLMKDSLSALRSQQIGAQLIDIDVHMDSVRLVSARGDAASLYFMQGEDGPDGASRTACDSLFVLFSAGKPDSIVWRSGVSGEYYPENLVGDGPSRYYLPHYKDIGNRPRKVELNARLQRDIELRNRRDSGLP